MTIRVFTVNRGENGEDMTWRHDLLVLVETGTESIMRLLYERHKQGKSSELENWVREYFENFGERSTSRNLEKNIGEQRERE